MARRRPHIEIYQEQRRRKRDDDSAPGWRYRYWSANGQNTENPGQPYTAKSSAIRAAARQHPGVEIRDSTGKVLRTAVMV